MSLGEEQSIVISSEGSSFNLQPLSYACEGVEVLINVDEEESWAFDFAALFGKAFELGKYENAYRYPFHSSYYPGIEILSPEGGFKQSEGLMEKLHH